MLSLDATSPGTYRQRGVSSLQSLFRSHFLELCTRYEADFAKSLGKFRLERISMAVGRFLECGDYTVNSDWRRTLGELARKETSDSFEVVHVLQGTFLDHYVLGFLGLFDGQKGVLRYWGDGKTPIDWTTREDAARFTAVAALDDGKVPERFFVCGERMDVLTFAKTWEATRGKKLALERLGSLEELEGETRRRLAQEPQNMFAWLPLMYARAMFGGQALLGSTHNARYPAIKAETVAQAIARGAV